MTELAVFNTTVQASRNSVLTLSTGASTLIPPWAFFCHDLLFFNFERVSGMLNSQRTSDTIAKLTDDHVLLSVDVVRRPLDGNEPRRTVVTLRKTRFSISK